MESPLRDGLWVFLGGGAGSVARFFVQRACVERFGVGFPTGTLVVNLAGCFVMGILWALGASTQALSPSIRLALSVGVLGGFTTYSSFNQETLGLFQQGNVGLGLAYVFSTLAGGLLAAIAGGLGARALIS